VDMHATDLVGINGITRVLLVCTCQRGVPSRPRTVTFNIHNYTRHCAVRNVKNTVSASYIHYEISGSALHRKIQNIWTRKEVDSRKLHN
jgi:hypothetical protein